MYVTLFSPLLCFALPCALDVFIGLNLVRVLSIIACMLVFASSIVTMVHDVEAVNNFLSAEKSNSTIAATMLDCDYILYVAFFHPFTCARFTLHLFFFFFSAAVLSLTNRPASFGPF